MKVVSTEALTKLIQLVKSAFVSVDDTVETSEVELLDIVASKDLSNITQATKSDVTSWGMPSDSYIDLTLGASGAEYTAPADGFIYIAKGASTNQYITISIKTDSNTNLLEDYNVKADSNATNLTMYFPIRKNQKFTISYIATGTTNYFRFIYAKGEI